MSGDRWRFAPFWEIGGALGLSPKEVGETSLWEFTCAYSGWASSQGVESEAEALSDDAHEAMIAAFVATEKKAKANE